MLEVRDLRRSFGETRALTGCSFAAPAGTVHSILGENGSGKSTLVKILSGIIAPDGGRVVVGEKPIRRFSPATAGQFGVIPVLQEVLVAPNRSVLDNIFLGYDPLFRRRISASERADRARATLSRISGTPIDLGVLVETLPLPRRQIVTIARALVRNPRVLILDESTSTLDVNDRQTLFQEIRRLVKSGVLVIYISHRLEEVLDLSDAVTVLRNGSSVATVPKGDLSVSDLLHLMSPQMASELEHLSA